MDGTILLEGVSVNARFIGMSTAGSLTIGATGVIRSNTGLGGNAQIGIGNNFTAAMALANEGLISSQVSGRTITINAATSFANSGNLEALNGGILTITTAGWTNAGTIAVGPGSVVNLGHAQRHGGIGLFNNTGGTVNISSGTLDNTGNTMLLNSTTGSWTLEGGTLSGGTVDFADGTSLSAAANINNLLTGVTVNGDLNLSVINAVTRIGPGTAITTTHLANQSTEIGFLTGATMDGTILLEGVSVNARFIGMSTAGSLTIGATGVIRSKTGLGGNAQIGIGNNFTAAMALANGGLISSQVSGRTLTINAATSFANSGNLEALNGGILTITTAGWTNTGTIAVGPGSVVNLGPLNATAGIGTFNNTGGTVNISGTLNNTGNTMLLNSTTGSWTMGGGTLSGGTVDFANGTSLLVAANNNNLLTGVTVNGDLNLTAVNAVTRIGPGTTITTTHLANQNAEIGFLAGATVDGTILLEGVSVNTRFIGMSAAGTVTIGATGVIRSDTGFGGSAQLGIGNNYTAAMALTNNGLISSQISGRTLTINAAASFANSGNLEALNGGILTITTAGWTNTGTIAVGPGSVVNLGPLNATGGIGTFNNTGGTVNINGTLNNTGNTILLNSTTGSWTMGGGTLSGGTVNFANGAILLVAANNSNLLTGVTVNGDLNLTAVNAVTRIGPGTSFMTAHLANQNTEIGFLAGATMDGTILLEGVSVNTRFIGMSAAGTVTIGATGVIRSDTGFGGNAQIGIGNNFTAAMALANGGLISSQVSGRTLTINAATSFANSGNLEALNGGILTITTAGWTNTGTIAVVPGSVVNLGLLNATAGIGTFNNTGGTVNISGTLNNTGNTMLLNSTTGSWTMGGGTLSGGTVNFANGTSLLVAANNNNLLTGVTVNGDLNLTAVNAVTRIWPLIRVTALTAVKFKSPLTVTPVSRLLLLAATSRLVPLAKFTVRPGGVILPSSRSRWYCKQRYPCC